MLTEALCMDHAAHVSDMQQLFQESVGLVCFGTVCLAQHAGVPCVALGAEPYHRSAAW